MKHLRVVLLALACALSFTASAAPVAPANPPLRLCKDEDLSGARHMIKLTEKPVGSESGWYKEFKFQYMVFYPQRTYNFVAAKHPLKTIDDLKKALVQSTTENLRVIEHKYTLDDQGLLNLYTDSKMDYSFRCMVVVHPAHGEQAGDVMFNGYTKDNAEITKTYRRWPFN